MRFVSLLRCQYKNKHSSPSFYFATRTVIRASNSTILNSKTLKSKRESEALDTDDKLREC